jgi:IS4 transposase
MEVRITNLSDKYLSHEVKWRRRKQFVFFFLELYMYFLFMYLVLLIMTIFSEEKIKDNKLLEELVVVPTFKHEREGKVLTEGKISVM